MKTKRKGKEKKRERRKKKKKNRFYPESNSGPTAHQAVSLLLRHVNHIPKFLMILILLKAFSLEFIHSFIHSFIHFILPLTRNTTTVYRNTLKIIYNIPTKLFTRLNVVKARKTM